MEKNCIENAEEKTFCHAYWAFSHWIIICHTGHLLTVYMLINSLKIVTNKIAKSYVDCGQFAYTIVIERKTHFVAWLFVNELYIELYLLVLNAHVCDSEHDIKT